MWGLTGSPAEAQWSQHSLHPLPTRLVDPLGVIIEEKQPLISLTETNSIGFFNFLLSNTRSCYLK